MCPTKQDKVSLGFYRFILEKNANYRTQRQVSFAGHRSQVAGHRSQVTGHRSQVTGHRLQVTGHRLQVTGHIKIKKQAVILAM